MLLSVKIKYIILLTLLLLFALSILPRADRSESFIRDRVIQLEGNNIGCTGVQVSAWSGKTYILTAGHCSRLIVKGSISARIDEGEPILRRVLGEDKLSDLLILEGMPNLEGLDIAPKASERDKVRSFTHGHRYKTYETDGVLIQDTWVVIPLNEIRNEQALMDCLLVPKLKPEGGMCTMATWETVTTAFVAPGSSGGPVVDGHGDIVGIVSAVDDGYGYLVRLGDIQKFLSYY